MIEDIDDSEDPIPIPNVNEEILQKVIEWCIHHENDKIQEEENLRNTDIEDWDKNFFEVDQEMLFDIILAANYLDIKQLLDTGCKTVANIIKGKSVEEIRRIFNITNDFTPEEEAQIKKENEWAEDNNK
ncbi:hypothetical protein G6F33_012431 [Rhizopus arrhizus]|nr:hypothetical protein G6F33_012431 [Rhizopus arrhizus]